MKPEAAIHPGNRASSSAIVTVLTCALCFGTMFLARNALNFVAPNVVPELHLRPGHLGLLSAVLAIGWSVSGWVVPRLVNTRWDASLVLALLLVALALDCLATGMITGVAWLILSRFLCGIAGGPALPLAQNIVALSTPSNKRGLYMGLVQGIGGSLLAAIIAPIALVFVATRFGWRNNFFMIAIIALIVAWYASRLKTPAPNARVYDTSNRTLHGIQNPTPHIRRNIVLCSLIGGLMIGWLVLTTTFFPIFITSEKHTSGSDMSVLMSASGLGSLVGLIMVPYLSDYIGRRRALAGFAVLGLIAPAALMVDGLSFGMTCTLLFIGSIAGGTFPLFLAIIPSESVAADKIATSIGIVQGTSELLGGVVAPICIGWLANEYGLRLSVIVALLAAILAGLLATGLRTAKPEPHALAMTPMP